MNEENEIFSKNIRFLRKKACMKQEEVAAKIFVTPQAVSKWETSKSMPDINTLLFISKLFDINIEDLLNKDLSEIEYQKNLECSDKNIKFKNYRNVLIFNKKAKSYKRFLVTMILFFVFFITLIPTFFFNYDIFTLIGIGIVAFLNSVVLIFQIKILCHYNEITNHYFDTTIKNRGNIFKITIPINFGILISIVSLLLVLIEEYGTRVMIEYIYLIVALLLLSLCECLNFIFITKFWKMQKGIDIYENKI